MTNNPKDDRIDSSNKREVNKMKDKFEFIKDLTDDEIYSLSAELSAENLRRKENKVNIYRNKLNAVIKEIKEANIDIVIDLDGSRGTYLIDLATSEDFNTIKLELEY